MNITSNKDFNEFYENYITTVPKDIRECNCIFRGEPSNQFKLVPTIYRGDLSEQSNGKKFKNREIISRSVNDIEIFYKMANDRGLKLPTIIEKLNVGDCSISFMRGIEKAKKIPREYYEAFALAQHYEVATPFLDWSYDINIALFFASFGVLENNNYAFEDKENKFVIYVLYYQKSFGVPLIDNNLNKYYELLLIKPNYEGNINLSSQKGVLSYIPYDIDDELIYNKPYFGESLENMIKDKSELLKFEFKYNDAYNILFMLNKFNINYLTIFPGYHNIKKAMKIQSLIFNYKSKYK